MAIHKICRLQAVLLLLAFVGVSFGAASAQQDRDSGRSDYKYTLASFCGDYGFITTYGANIAHGLGTIKADGRGNLTGSTLVNEPGPNNTRTITNVGVSGTYRVNSDGTGSMVLIATLPNGSTASVKEDFLINKAAIIDGVAIATDVEDEQEEPSVVIQEASLVIHSYTLRTAPESCAQGY